MVNQKFVSKSTVFIFLTGLLIGGLGVFFFSKNSLNSDDTDTKSEVHLGPKGFVNPLVDCHQWSEKLPPKANLLKENLSAYIESSNKNNETQQISVFYRDLLNGPQIEIGAHEKFAAASLLKVPVLIYYMKLAEKDPSILHKKLKFSAKNSSITYAVQTVTPPPPMQDDQEYSVDELLSRMITFSDNYSVEMLLKNQPELNIAKLLLDMGITLDIIDDDYWISVRGNSSIYRILYNATYLSEKMSNATLQLLSLSNFKLGLRASLPVSTTVASKFGERKTGNTSQLHDCGIIYHPQRPYILCVMTKGQDANKLLESIRDISQIVWSAVDQR